MDQKTCWFCGEQIDLGTGIMYVRNDGQVYYFCASKCEKNFKLGRIPRKVKWTSIS